MMRGDDFKSGTSKEIGDNKINNERCNTDHGKLSKIVNIWNKINNDKNWYRNKSIQIKENNDQSPVWNKKYGDNMVYQSNKKTMDLINKEDTKKNMKMKGKNIPRDINKERQESKYNNEFLEMSINSSRNIDPIEQREHQNLHIEEEKSKHKIKMIRKV